MKIYVLHYNGECNCHPHWEVIGYFSTEALAQAQQDTMIKKHNEATYRYYIEEVDVVCESN